MRNFLLISAAVVVMIGCSASRPDGGSAGGGASSGGGLGTGGGAGAGGGGGGGGAGGGGNPADAGPCPFDGGPNPGGCAATWSDARASCISSSACGDAGLRCWYPGAGDFTGGCWATALSQCVELHAGQSEWRCAQ